MKEVENQSGDLIIPQYKIINKVSIEEHVLKNIINFCNNSVKQSAEGILFGREDENEILVDYAIPFHINDPNATNLVSYLETNRMDYTRVGFFFCNENSELLSRWNLKTFIDFQKKFPNAVIVSLDFNMLKLNSYPFKCYRLNKILMELVDLAEIEDESASQTTTTSTQNPPQQESQIFKKFANSSELLTPLKFSIVEDVHSFYSALCGKDCEILLENISSGDSSIKKTTCKKINLLNKTTDKFIEEQKKYINYYKVKKSYGKKHESEFLELLNKKGSDLAKMDKIDISIYSKNILYLTEKIKTLIDQTTIKNSLNLDLLKNDLK